MNFKKKIIFIPFLFLVVMLSIINFRNLSKTKITLFTWESKEISVGNLIVLSFLSGLTFSTLFLNNYKNKSNQNISSSDFKAESKDIDESNKGIKDDIEEFINRPPEREVGETQPTISVNYRVVTKNNNSDFENVRNESFNSNNNFDDWNEQNNDW